MSIVVSKNAHSYEHGYNVSLCINIAFLQKYILIWLGISQNFLIFARKIIRSIKNTVLL